MVQETIPEELWDIWRERADKGRRLPHGGHDGSGNPALREMLDRLARHYLHKCQEKLELFYEQVRLERGESDVPRLFSSEHAAALENVNQRIEDFDTSIARFNVRSMQTLLKNPGLEKEAQRQLLQSAGEKEKLAERLLSEIIKHAVEAACEHTNFNGEFSKNNWLSGRKDLIVPRITRIAQVWGEEKPTPHR